MFSSKSLHTGSANPITHATPTEKKKKNTAKMQIFKQNASNNSTLQVSVILK